MKILFKLTMAMVFITSQLAANNYIYADDCIYFDQDFMQKPSGLGYYNCRSAACLTTGMLIGTAVIAGMVIIVINQNHCSHSH